jgi:hypothetical protein
MAFAVRFGFGDRAIAVDAPQRDPEAPPGGGIQAG